MRDFFWQYFSNTGSIDAYMQYKQSDETTVEPDEMEPVLEEENEIAQ
ncbi:YqzL family protein [Paenibacillus aurantius]|uniref:YqzL family protein n=1 Tax=Paenibacillus aurantius TaxID=2918900 RepID=A0AA96RHE6_9BACL|nr:YqzL family protein [Paenibacillus aurantius]WNQ13466.1 YqzL family protein [Paenibacillus aurantius]